MGRIGLFHFLVAGPTSEDLFISAKNLFIAANSGGGHDQKEGPRPEGDGGRPAGASWQSGSK
jgi:hypothetical protein